MASAFGRGNIGFHDLWIGRLGTALLMIRNECRQSQVALVISTQVRASTGSLALETQDS